MALKRSPEPPSTDARRDAAAYHEMDHSEVNRTFVNDFVKAAGRVEPGDSAKGLSAGDDGGLKIIDLGCGPGQIAILLCQADPSIRVLAIDNEVEMLEIAKVEIDFAGMIDRITLHHDDITELRPLDDAIADAVVSNTVVHHLDEPAIGLGTAVRLVRPGGRLFIRDLFRPGSEAEIETLVQTYAAAQGDSAMQLLRQSFWASLELDEVREMSRGLGIDDTCVQMTSDRHWTLDWVKPV